jgi:outer membrane protein OmpA-like peptidoglycan-associated protein
VQDFPDTANPRDEIAKLDKDVKESQANQVDVLSPYNFKKANESLNEAKNKLDMQKSDKVILHSVAEARAYLDQSTRFAILSHANIEEVIVARHLAIQTGAPNLFSKDFAIAERDLKEITSDIEKNKLEKAEKDRVSLQLKYLDLELQSIKQTSLGEARSTIDHAIKEDAIKFAPQNLALAQKSVQETDAFITANRHSTDQINVRANEARQNANHLLAITRDSKNHNKDSSEDRAIQRERTQNKLTNKQGELDDKEYQLVSTEGQLAEEKSDNQSLLIENNILGSEQAFNQLFEEARAKFTKNEAEVYKQGNTLTIRLRGLKFPASQSTLSASNIPLLAKVQKVIKDFGKSSVTVEGHTDSLGGKTLNERLSSDRANTVKEYFISHNEKGFPINIESKGFDYQKPLASNKTSTGRAQNRRVDVLITTEQ